MRETTAKKFGYPGLLVKEYQHWELLCRYEQVTLGSLILICRAEADAFSKLPPEAFTELATIVPEVEAELKQLFGYDKINWLMLMMKDPEVHFHIVPRYSDDREFEGVVFKDTSYPTAPKLTVVNEISEITLIQLKEKLKAVFNE